MQYKRLATGSKWITVTLSGSIRSYTLSGLLANQKYKWSIRAKCGNTWTPFSYEINFATRPRTTATTMAEKSTTVQPTEQTLVVPNLLHRSQLWHIPNLPANNQVVVVDGNGRSRLVLLPDSNNKRRRKTKAVQGQIIDR